MSSEENPPSESQTQPDSYLEHPPAGASILTGYELGVYPPNHNTAPYTPPLEQSHFSQALPTSGRGTPGQNSPFASPPSRGSRSRDRTPSSTRAFRNRASSLQGKPPPLEWNELRRACYAVARFDKMVKENPAE
ncbi:hypothetical protein IAR50_007366 [Cryptococcus sp. DSM 104548]